MSTSTTWTKSPFAREYLCKGESYLVDGEVVNTRVHSVFVSGAKTSNIKSQDDNLPTRFVVVEVDLVQAHPRIMRDGSDINYKANTVGSKKYIEAKVVNGDQLAKAIGGSSTALPDDFLDAQRSKVHPATPNRFEFYIDETFAGVKSISKGAVIRFFTVGSSIFVERFESLSGQKNLFGKNGASAGAANLSNQWTAGVQAASAVGKMPGDGVEGVADDEWSDD
jgi:hypothetical protein